MPEVLNEIISIVTNQAVLIAAAAVLIFAFVGNLISFGNRFTNALVTGIIVALVLVGYGLATGQPFSTDDIQPIVIIAGIVFVADLIGNLLSFDSRLGSALATTLVFFVMVVVAFYVLFNGVGGLPYYPDPTR